MWKDSSIGSGGCGTEYQPVGQYKTHRQSFLWKLVMFPVHKAMSYSSGLNSQVDVQVIVTDAGENDVDKLEYQRPAYVAVGLIMAMTAICVLFPLIITSSLFGLNENYSLHPSPPCTDPCRLTLLESIPENLTFPSGSPSHLSTYEGWKNLLAIANKSIDIAALYWTLRGRDIYQDPSDWQGEDIFKELMKAGKERKIKIRIAQNAATEYQPNQDTIDLARAGAAEVRNVNFTRLLGLGVLHTKLWIVDGKHVYSGSANMDWRSLTQVKELGAVIYNCTCLAEDMTKIFDVYWELGLPNATVPRHWPLKYATKYNHLTPMNVSFNSIPAHTYISSSPAKFCPMGRTVDIDAILDIINKAQHYVYIAVMDYFPTTLYSKHTQFWPVIDDALRKVAIERGVDVRLMASWWNHSRPALPSYLRSLSALSDIKGTSIQVKLFHVPAYTEAQKEIPFARVNHNKYMVTDNVAYIGTSNWSADYFLNTGGLGLVINQTGVRDNRAEKQPKDGMETEEKQSPPRAEQETIQKQLTDVFLRDWNSEYAKPVSDPEGITRTTTKYAKNEL